LLEANDIIKLAKNTLRIESDALNNLQESIDTDFVNVVKEIANSNGRVVVTGIGKSAIVGQKIVATLNSTGTPSLFMHAADAIHGDLGMILKDDVVLCISNSGTSPEIKALVPFLKRSGNVLLGMTGDKASFLGTECNYLLNSHVELEACPNNLAPTTSTTAQMALGDALAVTLIEFKGFKSEDFAKYHPGGALGKKLYLKLSDIADHNAKPTVNVEDSLEDCIVKITEGRMGIVVVESENKIVGLITDGDLRRMLSSSLNIKDLKASDVMTADPMLVDQNQLAMEGVDFIKDNRVNHIILHSNKELKGIVHIQDLVREGLL